MDDAEYLRRIKEDSRRADAVHRRVMQEEFARQQAERIREVLEACLRAQDERQRQAERKAMNCARREQERIKKGRRERKGIEREHLEQVRLERERCEREAAQPVHATQLYLYEEKWAKLRSDFGGEPLTLKHPLTLVSFRPVLGGDHQQSSIGVHRQPAAQAHAGSKRRERPRPSALNCCAATRTGLMVGFLPGSSMTIGKW